MIDLFNRLRQHVSGENWWKAESPFEVVVGAILTQQTRWEAVEKAITNLKNEGPLDAEAVLNMPDGQLEELIRCTGFYRQKAMRLKSVSILFAENPDVFSLPQTELRDMLLSVKGIGKETADSIVLYGAGKPSFIIDAYTRRILECKGITGKYRYLKDLFEKTIPRDVDLYKEYHALFVEYGKQYCNRNRCEECPLPK